LRKETEAMMSKSARTVSRALNRASVACQNEVTALEPAARRMGGERGARLRLQSARRAAFVQDLAKGVVALGGVPATGPSFGARLSAVLRRVRELATGPHQGNHYIACEDATARTANAYSRALGLKLPSDVHFGVERQFAEVDFDRKELHWLVFGGELSQAPGKGLPWNDGRSPEAATEERRAASA
jgi:uncharacterized protein (TIGR02284 family)